MAFRQSVRQRLTLDVSDRIVDDLRIKQRVVCKGHEESADDSGQMVVEIKLLIQAYAAAGDGYGTYMGRLGIPDREMSLWAKNDTLVDATTGRILAVQGLTTNKDWLELIAKLEAESENDVILQGDWFEEMAKTKPVLVENLKRMHILLANRAGKFA